MSFICGESGIGDFFRGRRRGFMGEIIRGLGFVLKFFGAEGRGGWGRSGRVLIIVDNSDGGF